MGNDEREQTLNQLLSEMDGFKENEDIIVIAATNRRDVLDAALLRPGRFDRIVAVPLPDFSSRVKVLETHARSKKLGPVSLELIAEQTAGFSGADLQNLLNEAALLSVRNNLTEISRDTIMQALEKTMVGVKKETDTRSLDTKQRVAIHEAGHAVIALLFPEYFNFVKVTIQNTYSGAGGYTIFTDNHEIAENGLYTKDYLKKRLRVLLGGRAAESLLYGDDFVSVGAMEDLRQAALLSRRMINQFGMGEQLENYCNPYDNGDNPFVGRMVGTGNQVSEDLAASIDKEALFLVKDAYQETRKLLKEKESLMTLITEGLIKKNTLYPEDIITTF
jgi:cell division protease FtsH